MQVYIGGPLRIKKFRNLKLYTFMANTVQELGFKPYIPHIDTAEVDKTVDENKLYQENILALDASSFAIFEITHPSHGVGMEIQYAILNKIPFFCIVRRGVTISKMIKGNINSAQLIQFSNLEELRTKLKGKIGQKFPPREYSNQPIDRLGKFISVEGIDLSGKSTICRKIERALAREKRNVILVSDPPLIQPWQDLKRFFEKQQKMSRFAEATLLLSARLDNYERVIKPALERGNIVLSDRYVDSWFAYQSYRLKQYFYNIDDAIDFLIHNNEFLCQYSFLSMPDLTILVVDEPQETLKRARFRNSLSKYENLETQIAIQNIYLKIAERFRSRFRVIDARDKDVDAVFKEAYNLCEYLLR